MNLTQEQLAEMSDETIYQLCRKFGEQALYWRRRFTGLLPEVYRRRLYKRKNMSSIFEFAKKLAGMSEEQVRRTLNIDVKFEDKPILRSLLVNGEVSVNKLAKIASIATVENQAEIATQVQLLSTRALETLVRDEKFAKITANSLYEPISDQESVHVNTKEPQLDNDVKHQLAELQEKGININELIRDMLQKRTEDIKKTKDEIARNIQPAKSNYIPVKIKKIIAQEYGTKCSIDSCFKPSINIHHTQQKSISKNNNPHYLAPLCEVHHEIAHTVDLQYHEIKSRKINQL